MSCCVSVLFPHGVIPSISSTALENWKSEYLSVKLLISRRGVDLEVGYRSNSKSTARDFFKLMWRSKQKYLTSGMLL